MKDKCHALIILFDTNKEESLAKAIEWYNKQQHKNFKECIKLLISFSKSSPNRPTDTYIEAKSFAKSKHGEKSHFNSYSFRFCL